VQLQPLALVLCQLLRLTTWPLAFAVSIYSPILLLPAAASGRLIGLINILWCCICGIWHIWDMSTAWVQSGLVFRIHGRAWLSAVWCLASWWLYLLLLLWQVPVWTWGCARQRRGDHWQSDFQLLLCSIEAGAAVCFCDLVGQRQVKDVLARHTQTHGTWLNVQLSLACLLHSQELDPYHQLLHTKSIQWMIAWMQEHMEWWFNEWVGKLMDKSRD